MVDITKADDLLAMSDDDFANMNPPEASSAEDAGSSQEGAAKTAEEIEADRVATEEAAKAHDAGDPEPDPEDDKSKDPKDEQLFDADGKSIVKAEPTEEEKAAKAAEEEAKKKETPAKAEGETDKTKKADDPSLGSDKKITPPTPEEAQSFFTKIMTPFKANGKLIELKTPEEAIQLMQMGANYTRKMQDIQPHRKMLTMLQNNNLLDEGKLDYLISLDKKDPEAIKKFIKESGIDPLDIDTTTEPSYRAGNHMVSDNEVALNTVMEDIGSTPEGKMTIVDVNTNWDQASKEALWENPEILTVIHAQRENGVYAKITAEMDRQKLLGQIPATTPFLKAYKDVGDQLYKTGSEQTDESTKGTEKTEPAATPKQEATPEAVGTSTLAPKAQVENGDKASAASPTRSTPRKAKEIINPLSMSDDDFIKQFNGRV